MRTRALTLSVLAVAALSAAAGASATLALTRVLPGVDARSFDELPAFEERFAREFGLGDRERALVRTILRDYRDRRREIEGQAAASARAELTRAGREVDWQLRGILPPPQRELYDRWSGGAR
ncbi:MAG: hypothetical protein JNJ88_04370 [Planctomycetes bacterium]|nr:hypothetical protein [Planctomycetota bacterium]